MNNLTFLLFLALFSCGEKDEVKPVSGLAVLHIEYRATKPTFAVNYQSRIQLILSGHACDRYSELNKDNIISYDTLVQGDQDFIFSAYTMDPNRVACGSYSSIPVSCKVTFNGKLVYQAAKTSTCGNVLGKNGKLEFIY